MAKKSTAIIILNWNGSKLLREFLPQVIAATDTKDADIIVADNGSTDDSVAVMQTEFPDIRLLTFSENLGFAGGYNRAIAETDYRFTILLNSDVAPAEGWNTTLQKYMASHAGVGACQPKLLDYRAWKEGRRTFEYAGASGGFLDKNGYPFCRGRIFSVCEDDHGQYDTEIPVFWASGAALMVRTDVYRRAGGLDGRFFAHMEEIDLCWRIQLLGFRIMAVPSATVYHLGGGSLPPSDSRKTYLNFRNNLLMLHKNLPDSSRRWKLFRRMALDGLAWLKFVCTLDFANAGAVFRAHRDFRSMRTFYTTHPYTDLLSKGPVHESAVNILKQYYILRRKYFSELKESRFNR